MEKNFTDKQQLATGFACSSRTVSPDEHTGFACSSRTVSPDEQCYRLISPVALRRFYTQTLLHTDAFTHRRFYTQTLLHTDAFTHRRFYTQTLLAHNTFTHRGFYTHTEAFRTKGSQLKVKNCNFSSVFDVQRPFRAKGLRLTK